MNYRFHIIETLQEIQGSLYKIIEIRVVIINGKFPQRALHPGLRVSDDADNVVDSFITIISGNQKELSGYFTVDAFTNFTVNSKIEVVYGGFDVTASIENVNVHEVTLLPDILASIPHEIADNEWLESIINNNKNL